MHNTVTRLYNEYLKNYLDEGDSIIDVEKEEIDEKYDLTNLLLLEYDCGKWMMKKVMKKIMKNFVI